jgi:hypothetical protein
MHTRSTTPGEALFHNQHTAGSVNMATPKAMERKMGDRSQERSVRESNIVAAKAVADAVRTSLGPRGMDKMIQNGTGEVVITNDGATILKMMEVSHPTAKMLVDLSKSQDVEAGDGTTTVTVIAGSLLNAAELMLKKGIHPTIISESFLLAAKKVTACSSLPAIVPQSMHTTPKDRRDPRLQRTRPRMQHPRRHSPRRARSRAHAAHPSDTSPLRAVGRDSPKDVHPSRPRRPRPAYQGCVHLIKL